MKTLFLIFLIISILGFIFIKIDFEIAYDTIIFILLGLFIVFIISCYVLNSYQKNGTMTIEKSQLCVQIEDNTSVFKFNDIKVVIVNFNSISGSSAIFNNGGENTINIYINKKKISYNFLVNSLNEKKRIINTLMTLDNKNIKFKIKDSSK